MERKYLFFKTAKGCLSASLGMIVLLVGIVYLAINSFSKWQAICLIVIYTLVVIWGAFAIDKDKT